MQCFPVCAVISPYSLQPRCFYDGNPFLPADGECCGMKKLFRQLSVLLVAALVVSSLLLGFGQVKSYAEQPTIQYRIYCETSAENCSGVGTDNDYKLKIFFDDSEVWYSAVIVDTFDPDQMQSNDNNNMVVWGPAKPITSTGIYQVNNTIGGNWYWDVIKIYAEFTSGTWTEISSLGSGHFDSVGGTINVPYNGVMDTTYQRALTFNGNGGTVNGNSSYTFYTIQGATYPASLTPTDVVRAGYIFMGWSPSVPSTVPAVNTSYTAQWAAETDNVFFNTNNGEIGPSATMSLDAPIIPPVLTRPGYLFTGWSPVLPSAVIDGVNTYTAQWSAGKCQITFDANGGLNATSVLMEYGAALSAPTVVRTGYTFLGWSLSVPSTVPPANTTYTAQWSPNMVSITFSANGGTGGKTASYLPGAALVPPVVTKAGYIFTGWSPAVPSIVVRGSQNFVAQWVAED